MQKIIHKASARGRAELGWLKSRYSFSFADWYEPSRMSFGALRVLNDDTLEPNSGFGMHSHKDMEIVTIVTEGTVTHRDSLGNEDVVRAGEVQLMSAGTGVIHSEYNNSPTEQLRLFQIWIIPNRPGPPRYEKRALNAETQHDTFQLVAAPEGTKGALSMRQQAYISLGEGAEGESLSYTRHDSLNGIYLFVISGEITVMGETLGPRDALGLSAAEEIDIFCKRTSRILCIEVPVAGE